MTSRLADFEVRATLGEGGSAVVYDAEVDGHRVALKVLREELALSEREKQRFVDEARRMVQVDHPGLVKLERAGVLPDGRPFLAMPFVDGTTLARRLERGPLALDEAVKVFGVLARAVATLHDAGIVHRDIKPENILLVDGAAGARPVLLDFGIARDVDAGQSTTTAAGKIRGTPAYMAPERFFGTPASPRSDIYELGVTFYMMLVGRLPWGSAESVSDRLAPKGPDAYEPAVGAAIARVTLRALSTRPESRPASARAFAEEIEQAFEDRHAPPARTTETFAPLQSAPPPPLAAQAPSRRTRLLFAVPLLGATGLVAFAALTLSRSPTSSGEARSSAAAPNEPAPQVVAAKAPGEAPRPPASPIPSAETASPSAPVPAAATSTNAASRAPRPRPTASAAPSAKASAPSAAATVDPFLEDRK
jgi:eukaryotic-like serine/threonine-protein kinase